MAMASQIGRPPSSSTQRTADAKKAFNASLNSVGAKIDDELQVRAKDIHVNAKALTTQEDQLRKQTKGLARDGDSLEKMLEKARKEIQSLGDLDAIMEDLDADLDMIEETLRLVGESEGEGEDASEERPSNPKGHEAP